MKRKSFSVVAKKITPIIFYSALAVMIDLNLLMSPGIPLTGYSFSQNISLWELHFANMRYAWNEYLSQSTTPFLYSPLKLFGLVGRLFNLELGKLIVFFDIFTFTLAGTSFYFLSKYLIEKQYANKLNGKLIMIASFIGGTVYMFNLSFTIGDRCWMLTRYCYSLIPLSFLLFLKSYEEKRRVRYCILHAILLTQFIYDPRFFITSIILMISYVVFDILIEREGRKKKYMFSRGAYAIVATLMLFLLLQAHALFVELSRRHVEIFVANPTVTESRVGNFDMFHLLTASSHMVDVYKYVNANFLKYLTLFIPILAFLGTILENKSKHILFFLTIYIFSIAILLIPPIHIWLMKNIPYGTLLRTWRPFDTILSLSLSSLFTFSIVTVSKNLLNKKLKTLLYIFFLAVFLITLFTLIYSSFSFSHNEMKLTIIPKEYSEANKWLRKKYEIEKFFKVLWIPEMEWFGVNTYPTWYSGYGATQGFPEFSSEVPTYFHYYNIFTHYYSYTLSAPFKSLIRESSLIQSLSVSLGNINVKYLCVHIDIPGYYKITLKMVNNLNKSQNFRLVYHNGIVYIFENLNYKSKIHIPLSNVLCVSGLSLETKILESIFKNKNDNKSNKSVRNANIHISTLYSDELVDIPKPLLESVIVVTDRGNIEDEMIIHLAKEKYLIFPSDYACHYDPYHWSIGYLSDPHHGVWHTLFGDFHYHDWAWSYKFNKGFTFTSASDVLQIPLSIEKSDNYKVLVRCFKNKIGGLIKLCIDNKIIYIYTKSRINKFVWVDLGKIYLKKGKHKIILENVKGFNAVNLFALIPENEYYKAKEEIEKLLQNKTIIYLFEAESDLYRKNAKISKEFGGDVSNGEVLKFVKDGEAWQNIEIVKNGTYRLALRGVGEFKVRIGDHEFILKSNSLNFTYTTLFDLTKGKYRLEILASKDSYLDVIWLYSAKTNQTIDQLFEVKEEPAEIINYTKINPTLWKVKVNATKPFMLSFAESYDPLWEARVYKDGKLVEKVRSIPLYSIINGFWINETGELEIVIRYTPQDWFELGLKISGLTFIGCIGYLFYNWRGENGDR